MARQPNGPYGRTQRTLLQFEQQHRIVPQQALPEGLRGKVDFLLVSFDTERDVPAVLHAYREKMRLPTGHWTLLRGSADDVRELAALLGVNFQKDARGQFMHSNVITVLNAEGEIVHQQTGLRSESSGTIRALERALAPKQVVQSR